MRIHAIQTGTVAVKERQRHGSGPGPLRLVNTIRDRRWTAPLPILAWLVEHPEGLIVVDTGETARASEPGYFPRWHPYFRLAVREWVEPGEELGPQLRRLGFSAEDVRWVVLTHLHTDHAGGLHHVDRSEVLVSRTELSRAGGALGRARGYLPDRWPRDVRFRPLDFARAAPFGPFPCSYALTRASDVVVLPTPGHTAGHVSVAVRRSDDVVVLAGDASYTQALMLAGHTDGVTDDDATAAQTLRRLRSLAAEERIVYLPSHDPDSVRRLHESESVPAALPGHAGGRAARPAAAVRTRQ
jgi:N-acyl homoserine lactone hydrolase